MKAGKAGIWLGVKAGIWLGRIIFWAAGLALFAFWVLAMVKWMGVFGFFLALALTPGVLIFPLVFWLTEHHFPWLYFLLWALGWAGAGLQWVCLQKETEEGWE